MEKPPRFLLSIALLLLFISIIGLVAAQNSEVTTDQSALLALKSHITNDPQNFLTTNWSTNTSVCNWVGVTCNARHLRVAALNLSYMGLTGTIPPHLGNLSFLVEMRLENNSFHGTLPHEMAQLHRLRSINLGFNNFLGTIPAWFGLLSKLQVFSMNGNQFSGSVSTALFNCTVLQVFDLEKNQLTGSIPREIGNLTRLKAIYLDSNNFTEIPNEIGNLDQLEHLFVQMNTLEGPVPAAVFNMSSLTILALAGSYLTGRIPDNMCQHLPSLQMLGLGQNLFEGPLPSTLGQCKELFFLSLGINEFTGSIPKSVGNLTKLTVMYLSENNLTGTLPDEIGNLQNLENLELGLNSLNGPIPSTVFNMSKIVTIFLGGNQLSGRLPADIGLRVPNLEQLLLGDNKLTGVIPNFIANGSMLRRLDLSDNSFTGFIPSTLCALTNLEILAFQINNLTIDASTAEKNILSCFANLRKLSGFHLAENPLNTGLPTSFGRFSTISLHFLDLSHCNLSGNVPNTISNLSSLVSLDLGYNQLNGSIPNTMGKLQNLQRLDLHGNNLEGHIPSDLCKLVNLGDISLYDNKLSGSIPSCIGNLVVSLRTLSLGSNLLTSTIPSSLWKLTNMLHLNLSSNSLVGPVPEDIGKLKVVIDLDLSNNNFSGKIPSSIGGLQNMINLSLANNNLEGPIPSSFDTLKSLEFLDLSKNKISGVIPKSLESLSYLKYLNLSFNMLHGEIPTGGPFKNFPAESFVSNGLLCGESRLNLPPCHNSKSNSRKSGTFVLKYIIPAIILAILLVASASVLILRGKRKVEVAIEPALLSQLHWKRFSHLELRRATNGFNESNLLGIGSFGSVYKGALSDGIDVAVKVFNLQLEGAFKSFDTECEVLSNILHRNLIKIISCCSQLDFKALVLQYMPNGSLEKWLYSQTSPLNILQRLNIMIDAALALEYLHHGYTIPIVHCDVKPSNILLDDGMVAYVADFGIAKLLGEEDSMTRTMTLATIGYMAPEFGTDGIVSTRGDVYSFGILLMETFTKRRPTDEMFVGEMSLKHWIANSLTPDGSIVEVVDADLLGTDEDCDFVSKRDCISSIMGLALACCVELPEARINMEDAAATLKKIKLKFLKDCGGVQS